jgi:hypothetical protein
VEVIRCPYSGNLSSSCAIVSASPVNASSSALGDDEKPFTTLARHQERRSRPVRCVGQVVLSQCAPVPFYWGHGRPCLCGDPSPAISYFSRNLSNCIRSHIYSTHPGDRCAPGAGLPPYSIAWMLLRPSPCSSSISLLISWQ